MTPIGSMIYYPSLDIPDGYLVCDGSEKLIADYPLLFNAIGYIGGEDVDTGYFRLPDMRGNVPAGFYEGLNSSNPLAGNFGDKVGAPTKSLSVANLAKHKHDIVYSEPNANITQKGVSISHDASGSLQTLSVESFVWANQTANKFGGGSNNIFAAYEGSGSPFSIVQPTMLYHWLIKAKHVVTLGGYTNDFEVKGKLIMPEGKWVSSGGAIDMRNSDIVNANSILMNDEADSASEGILFLKQGATPGSNSYADYECLRGYRGKLYYNENPVVESGSNSNGSWTKWMDGTMICYMNKLYSNINITKEWGSMYETDTINLGNFPANFVNIPTVTATCTGGSTVFIEAFRPTKTSLGTSWFARPGPLANTETTISFIAIGKWK